MSPCLTQEKIEKMYRRGIASELIVAIELIKKGYEVFRPLALRASCDLIALRNGKCLRVEVKTMKRVSKKSHPWVIERRFKNADLFVACSHNDEVTFSFAPKHANKL